MKEDNLRAIRATCTMNSALLTALFIHHPKQEKVLDSFRYLAQHAVDSAYADNLPTREAKELLHATEAWTKVMSELAGTGT